MAWSTPRTWIVGEMVTNTIMNTHWRDQLLFVDNHIHNGSAGMGSQSLSGIAELRVWEDQSGSPNELGEMQRNGSHMEFFNGANSIVFTLSDQAAGTVSLRTLGAGGTQISDGTHLHFEL